MKVNKKTVEKFIEEVRSGKKDPEVEIKNLPLAELGNLIGILKKSSGETVGEILKIAEKYQNQKRGDNQTRKEEKMDRHYRSEKRKKEKKPSFT